MSDTEEQEIVSEEQEIDSEEQKIATEEKQDKKGQKKRIGKRVLKGIVIGSIAAGVLYLVITYGWFLLFIGASAWENRPVEKKVRAAVRKELHSRRFELEKEPDDYGVWETYKIIVPGKDEKEDLEFHAIHAIYDDIFNTGTVVTDYYDTILKKCYDSYEGEKGRILLSEETQEGLLNIEFSYTYENIDELDSFIREAENFGAYADRLYNKGFRFYWKFMRRIRIECEDGETRDFEHEVWYFNNKDRYQDVVKMADFLEELKEDIYIHDVRELYQSSPETEVYDEKGKHIEWENLPGIRTLKLETEEGYEDAGFDHVRVFYDAFPIKDLYLFLQELQIQTEGTTSDFSVMVTGSDGELHRYRFAYSFYDDEGFYYYKDGERITDSIWMFSVDSDLVSEIVGMPLFY